MSYVDATNGCVVTRTFTITATNDCGSDTKSVVYTWTSDVTPPVFTFVPSNQTIECPAVPSFGNATASDACGSVTITASDVTTPGACAGSYSVTRTWTATDACGNSSSASQTITVVDTQAPVISGVGSNATIECPAVPVFSSPTASDGCDANVSLTYQDVTTPGACAGSYSVTRTWTATDACGNSSSASQTITVVDTQAPVISGVGSNGTIECPAVPVFSSPTASDGCDANGSLTYQDVTTPGACAGSYSVTRTWTATDTCGNSSSASQTITVVDTTPPSFAFVPSDQTVAFPSQPVFDTPQATDGCSAVSVQYQDSQTQGACGTSYTRTWIATDGCGNSQSISQTITVTMPITAVKFYDSNGNGVHDSGEPTIAGWQFMLADGNGGQFLAVTDGNGVATFATFGPAPYTVTEVSPNEVYWQATTPTTQSVACGGSASFGNICLGGGNGFTPGFWSNKNGERTMNDGGSAAPELAMLSGLNLRKADGSDFDPNSYSQFRNWILNATATNMAYMLSAHLAAMALNVEAGFVSSAALVYAPGCSPSGYISIGDLMAAANASLGTNGNTTQSGPARDYQTCLKNALDKANNNKNFVQSSACAFTFSGNTISSSQEPGVEGVSESGPEQKTTLENTTQASSVPLPKEFGLDANYPNPFNPSTTIRYAMKEDGIVRLTIYNVLGQPVATLVDGVVSAGFHQITWNAVTDNGIGLPSGIYFYRLEVKPLNGNQGFVQSKKMVLMK